MLILIYLILMASKSLCVYSVPSGPPETAKNVEVNKAISLRYRITQAKVEISGLNRKRCSMSVALTYVCLFRRNFFCLSFLLFHPSYHSIGVLLIRGRERPRVRDLTEIFFAYSSKNRHPGKLHCTFRKVSTVISIHGEGKALSRSQNNKTSNM